MTDWQPIETAPRDGTAVIVTDGKLRAIATAPKQAMTWVAVSGKDIEAYRDKLPEQRLEGVSEMGVLTHWMPLPAPPGESKP